MGAVYGGLGADPLRKSSKFKHSESESGVFGDAKGNSGCMDSLKHCSFAQPGLTFLSWDRLRSTLIVEIDKGLYV